MLLSAYNRFENPTPKIDNFDNRIAVKEIEFAVLNLQKDLQPHLVSLENSSKTAPKQMT